MIPRSNPLPEPPEPNAWLPTWAHRAAQEGERVARLEARLADAEGDTLTDLRRHIASATLVRDAYAEKGDDPIWPGAWFALPDLATGWRIRTLYSAMDAAPVGTTLLPYMGAAIGLCWRAAGVLLAVKGPAGPVHRWTDDDLLVYGWRVVEELHAEGVGPGDVIDVGRVIRDQVVARLLPVSKEAVGARADFSARRPAVSTGSSGKLD